MTKELYLKTLFIIWFWQKFNLNCLRPPFKFLFDHNISFITLKHIPLQPNITVLFTSIYRTAVFSTRFHFKVDKMLAGWSCKLSQFGKWNTVRKLSGFIKDIRGHWSINWTTNCFFSHHAVVCSVDLFVRSPSFVFHHLTLSPIWKVLTSCVLNSSCSLQDQQYK